MRISHLRPGPGVLLVVVGRGSGEFKINAISALSDFRGPRGGLEQGRCLLERENPLVAPAVL